MALWGVEGRFLNHREHRGHRVGAVRWFLWIADGWGAAQQELRPPDVAGNGELEQLLLCFQCAAAAGDIRVCIPAAEAATM